MKKTFSRLSCVLLAVVMLVGLLPAGMVAFAADAEPVSSVESVEYDFNGLESGVNVYDACVEYNPSTNPNWAFFDMSVDYKNITSNSYKRWAGYTSKGESHNGGHGYLKIADLANYTASNGTMYNTPDAWTALKFKSERPLVPGKYTISFNVVDSGPARTSSGNEKRENRLLTAYVAEYVKGQDEGSYYKDNGIQVMSQKITHEEAEPAKRDPKSYAATTEFNVTDPNAEFVLFLELEGLEIWMDSFKIEKTGDFATSLSVKFAQSKWNGVSVFKTDGYDAYADGRIWKSYDAIDYIKEKALSGTAYAADITTSYGFRIKTFTKADFTVDNKLTTTSTALEKVPAWAALRFKSTNPLQPGEYTAEITSANSSSVANIPLRVYVAEYDPESGKTAADYATEENLAFDGKTVQNGVARSDDSVVVTNPNAELVVIFKMGDTSGQTRITNFKISRVGDVQAEAPAAPAITEYNFLQDTATLSNGTCIKALDSYAATGRNWKWLGANDTLLGAIGLNTAGNAKAEGRMSNGHIELMPQADADSGDSWHSFVLEAPKAAGIYKLTIETTTESHTTLGGGESTSEIWVAEYRGGEAGDYMTNENLINSGEKGWIDGTVLGSKYISVDEDTEELVFIVKDQGNVAEDKEPKICYEKITLTPVTKNLLTGDVNVYVHSIVNGDAGTDGITATDDIEIGKVETVEIGKEITLTATEVIGAEFSHWQTASGTFLSDNDTYKFKANTNTAVVGVFENAEVADDENVTVSFYDGFGGRIEQKTFDKGTVFSTIAEGVAENFRGYIFSHWASVDDHEANDPVNKNTIAVAQYTADPEAKYTVTINGGESVGYAYNAEVIATSEADNFSYWKRGDKIVSYEKSYTFNVWGNTVLTEVTGVAVEKAPIVILEKDGNEYMVEYSLPDDCSFVEAGIVSSESGTPTVGSFNKKASSKRLSDNHGQFTAKTDDEVVRGYVIYKDAERDLVVAYSN